MRARHPCSGPRRTNSTGPVRQKRTRHGRHALPRSIRRMVDHCPPRPLTYRSAHDVNKGRCHPDRTTTRELPLCSGPRRRNSTGPVRQKHTRNGRHAPPRSIRRMVERCPHRPSTYRSAHNVNNGQCHPERTTTRELPLCPRPRRRNSTGQKGEKGTGHVRQGLLHRVSRMRHHGPRRQATHLPAVVCPGTLHHP